MGYFKETLIGTGWMGGLRALSRGISFAKIAILARLLTPKEFGLFGIAGITLAFLETFTETGVNVALVQKEEEIDPYVSTAWVLSIIRGAAIGLLMAIGAKAISSFFHQPEAHRLLLTASLIPVIRGFINPATINFVKKLQFKNEFILRGLSFFTDSLVAVVSAVILKSATAIIYGMLAAAVIEVALSFWMSDLRPKLQLMKSQAKKLIGFGKWVTAGEIMNYLAEQFDDIVVGRILGATQLGIYQVAYKLSILPSGELAQTISKVSFPVYAKIAGDPERLWRAVKKTTAVIGMISLPAGIAIAIFPRFIIQVLLGSQWLTAAEVLRLLAVYGVFRALSQAPSAAIYALGRPDIAAKIRTLRFSVMALLLLPLIGMFGLSGAAAAVVISAAISHFPLWIIARRLLWRPH